MEDFDIARSINSSIRFMPVVLLVTQANVSVCIDYVEGDKGERWRGRSKEPE